MKPKGYLPILLFASLLLASCAGVVGADSAALPDADAQNSPTAPAAHHSLIVAPETAPCAEDSEETCLQVKYQPDEDWVLLSTPIQGFEYQPGYRYTLMVEELDVLPPGTDAANVQYALVEIQEKTEVETMSAGLSDYAWVLHSYGSATPLNGVLEKVQVTLQYDPVDGRVYGSAGCNKYFATVRVENDSLTFETTPMGTTRMACSEEVMAQERQFLSLLSAVNRFAIEEDNLYLFTEDDSVLVFSPKQ